MKDVTCAQHECVKNQRYADGYCDTHHNRKMRGHDMDSPILPAKGGRRKRPADTLTHRYCGSCKQWQSLEFFTKSSNAMTCADCLTWRSIKCTYGITKDDWLAMFSDQQGKCAVCDCELETSRPSKKVVVDHCHNSMKVRAILCNRCNVGIGYAESIGLQRIADYMIKHAQ